MRIKWYGTASLLVESGDTRILIDPYLKSCNPDLPPVPLDEARTAKAIFITHPHLDHFSDIDTFTEGGARQVYVSQSGIEHARKNGLDVDCMLPLAANERHRVGALTIQTFASRHCVFDAATVLRVTFSPRTWLHAKTAVSLLRRTRKYRVAADDILALELSDGEKTVVVLGSAGMEEGISYPQNADLFVFPYQGRTRMHKYMQKFLDEFEPKAVMIDHHDDAFPPLTHQVNVKKFAAAVHARLPEAKAIVPVENEWYEV